MSVPTECRICSVPLDLRFRGAGSVAESQRLSPTNHRPGEHGDLFVCRHCGTVQQPSLPEGQDLHELYRGVEDEAYLDEEAGRRATARRLLDLIGRHVPAGRLLDVGCGHGIVLADVLEHLDDPVAAIDRCQGLLAPGGVLCVVTPDPASPTARFAGKRWWGYLPAHTYLLPRKTLRELLSARGLVISVDVPLVRSFALRYWVGGLAERSERGARAMGWLRRSRLGRTRVSLSLGDERVVLTHRVEPIAPPEPRVTDRGGEQKVHIVLPAYNATRTIPLVAAALPRHAADRALLVDDASPDETSTVALREGFHVLRHPANRGYGANQKTCYTRAAIDGADIVVMVHADNQYDP